MTGFLDISVIIPALNEADNLEQLIPRLHTVLDGIGVTYEIIVVDGGSRDNTVEVVEKAGGKLVTQKERGYGGALRSGFSAARGHYLVTCDADMSHEPEFMAEMWRARDKAEVIVASRYIPGGRAIRPRGRKILSLILNKFMGVGLSLPLRDLSSGFRMYRRSVLESIESASLDFDVLQEILVKILAKGWRVLEVPFCYRPRRSGRSHAKLLKFGIAYLRTFTKMWRLRNSINFCDYDERAYNSRIFLQRYWQRTRCKIVLDFARRDGKVLDVGCGSSKIIASLANAVALDLKIERLRYIRKTNRLLVQATAGGLPFPAQAFDCVICSEVIEHTREPNVISELARVLKPNGMLVVGTPDYAKWTWRLIEAIYARVNPGGYADEHVTKYTFTTLVERLRENGLEPNAHRYICNSELILRAIKTNS